VIQAQFLSPVLLVRVVMHPACVELKGPGVLGTLAASQSSNVQHQGGQG
jgi:hypothetical protein